MRNRTKWRNAPGKDKVKEASRKLKVILRNSRKLNISSEDLGKLKGTDRLRAVFKGDEGKDNWLFFGAVGSGLLIVILVLVVISGALQDTLCSPKNTTKEIQIQTIRIERLPLDRPLETSEESTIYNDSEDGDEGHLRPPPHLRLRRGR